MATRKKADLVGAMHRKIDGKRYRRKVGTRTKGTAKQSAAISRKQGKCARVLQVRPGRWVVYTRTKR